MILPRQVSSVRSGASLDSLASSTPFLSSALTLDITSTSSSSPSIASLTPISSTLAPTTISASSSSTSIIPTSTASTKLKAISTKIPSSAPSAITTSSVASTSATPMMPATPSATISPSPIISSQSTQEFFGTIFKGPLNIALTSLVIVAIVALIAVVIAFCVRRSKRNKRKSASRIVADGEKSDHVEDEEKDSAEDELNDDESDMMVSQHPQAIYARRFERNSDAPRAPFVARPLVMPAWTAFGQQQQEQRRWSDNNGPNQMNHNQLPRGGGGRPQYYSHQYQSQSQRPQQQQPQRQRIPIDQSTAWIRPESRQSGSLPTLVIPSIDRSASMTSISAVVGSPLAPLSRKEAWSPSYDHIVPLLSQFVTKPDIVIAPTPTTRSRSPTELSVQPTIDRALDPRSIPMDFTPIAERPSQFANITSLPTARLPFENAMTPQTRQVSNMVHHRWDNGSKSIPSRLAVASGNGTGRRDEDSPDIGGSMDSHSCYSGSDAGHQYQFNSNFVPELPTIKSQSLRSQLPSLSSHSSTSFPISSSISSNASSSTSSHSPASSSTSLPPLSLKKSSYGIQNRPSSSPLLKSSPPSSHSRNNKLLGPTSYYSPIPLLRRMSSRRRELLKGEKRESGMERLRRARTIVQEERAVRMGL